MKYKEISVNTTTEGSDLVAMILYDCGSEGVSIYDSKDILELIESDIIWDYIEAARVNKHNYFILLRLVFYPFWHNDNFTNMNRLVIFFPFINPISIVKLTNLHLKTAQFKRRIFLQIFQLFQYILINILKIILIVCLVSWMLMVKACLILEQAVVFLALLQVCVAQKVFC